MQAATAEEILQEGLGLTFLGVKVGQAGRTLARSALVEGQTVCHTSLPSNAFSGMLHALSKNFTQFFSGLFLPGIGVHAWKRCGEGFNTLFGAI